MYYIPVGVVLNVIIATYIHTYLHACIAWYSFCSTCMIQQSMSRKVTPTQLKIGVIKGSPCMVALKHLRCCINWLKFQVVMPLLSKILAPKPNSYVFSQQATQEEREGESQVYNKLSHLGLISKMAEVRISPCDIIWHSHKSLDSTYSVLSLNAQLFKVLLLVTP